MNENHQLYHTLEAYRSRNPAGFHNAVGYLLPDGLETAFEALEDDSSTPEQIRAAQNPNPQQAAKLKAFYAIRMAINLLQWEERENREVTQLADESDSQIDEDSYDDDSSLPEMSEGGP